MTKYTRVVAVAAMLSCFNAGQASAINMFAIGDLPVRFMTEEDRTLLSEAVRAVLEEGREGQVRIWENPKTGARGDLTPVASFEQAGRKCRDLEVANSAKGRSNRLVLTFCKQDDGAWKIESR